MNDPDDEVALKFCNENDKSFLQHLHNKGAFNNYVDQAYDLPARKSRTLQISCTYLLFFVKNCNNGL